MKYPEDYINKIICGDCLTVMKGIPDKAVDLVLTDPPYGHGKSVISNNKSRGKLAVAKDYGDGQWNIDKPSKELFDEIFRISKNQIIFGGNYFSSGFKDSQCWIVWDKNNGTNDFADCELAWTSFDSAIRKIKFTWNGMLQEDMAHKEYRWHPTQKPAELFKRILVGYSKEDEIVLDPFLGSGTTAVACKELGRKFIGIEISEKYCAIAQRRLAQEYLF